MFEVFAKIIEENIEIILTLKHPMAYLSGVPETKQVIGCYFYKIK